MTFKIGDLVTGSDGYYKYAGKLVIDDLEGDRAILSDSHDRKWAVIRSTLSPMPAGYTTGSPLSPAPPFPPEAQQAQGETVRKGPTEPAAEGERELTAEGERKYYVKRTTPYQAIIDMTWGRPMKTLADAKRDKAEMESRAENKGSTFEILEAPEAAAPTITVTAKHAGAADALYRLWYWPHNTPAGCTIVGPGVSLAEARKLLARIGTDDPPMSSEGNPRSKYEIRDARTEAVVERGVDDGPSAKVEEKKTMTNAAAAVKLANDETQDLKGNVVKLQFKGTTIEQKGNQIIVPKGMAFAEAREWLRRREAEEDNQIAIDEVIDCFPTEGANAFARAMDTKFGFFQQVATPGFFGPTPPVLISIDTGVEETTSVPWGRITIPGVDGYLETGIVLRDNRLQFRIGGQVKQKSKGLVDELASLTRTVLREQSIYKGHAIRVSFPDSPEEFNPRDCPKFMDVKNVRPEELIFPLETKRLVDTAVLTPIKRTAACRAHKIPLKRGVLLEGPYGVGKTLTANVVAKTCEDNGWTFIYLDDVQQLEEAMRFARRYEPAVIFAEDIDQATSGDRDDDMNAILNTLDGVDTKTMEVMVILTTNHVDEINQAMLRPGRLDTVISVKAPDAEAVQRLVTLYSRGQLAPETDLKVVGRKLAGQIPAVIREVVERSKLGAIGRSDGDVVSQLTASDLETAADGMLHHLALLNRKNEEVDEAVDNFARLVGGMVNGKLDEIKNRGLKRLTNGHGSHDDFEASAE
jgi:transitional endoplasmic reticulum ATPase